MTVNDYLPEWLVELLAVVRPEEENVARVFDEMFSRHGGNLELMARGGVWVSQKLAIENEILKLQLLKANAASKPTPKKRGRKPTKPTGLMTRAQSKRLQPLQPVRPVGAPTKHGLPVTTKGLAKTALDEFYEACGQNAKKAAQKVLERHGIDTSTDKGRGLKENIRREISSERSRRGEPPKRRRGGRR